MKTFSLLATALLATSAQAGTVFFSDDFNANTLGLNKAPTGWTVTNGTVDIVGPSLFGELCHGSGKCIDLDGSTNDAGVLSRSFSLVAGTSYTLTFDLAGNRRNNTTETGVVTFGTSVLNYSLPGTQKAYVGYSLLFKPLTTGNYTLSFANAGGDNIGAILDNVKITSAVPEPASAATLLLGLAGVAVAKRRRSV